MPTAERCHTLRRDDDPWSEMNALAMTLTPRALLRLFPNASKSCLAANGIRGSDGGLPDPKDYAPGVCDPKFERNQAQTLERGDEGKKQGAQRAHVRITRFGQRLLDHDNLTGGAKPLVDCLKEAGLIEDDSPEWLTLEVLQEKVPAGCERTEVKITWEEK